MRKSKVLSKLRSGEVARICGLYHPMHMYPSHAAHAGYDCVWLEEEHNTWDDREIQRVLAFHQLADIDCVVRPSTLERAKLYHLFENGATGILVPHVSSVEDARYLVEAVKFPPMGRRGLDGAGIDNDFFLGDVASYPETANRETFIAVQVETLEALEHVDEIAAVDGVDVLFIGPGDLALRLGCPPSWDEDRLLDAHKRVARAAEAAGIAWGRPAGSAEDIERLINMGARFISHGSDFEAVFWSMQNRYQVNFEKALAATKKEPGEVRS